ncbi:MAG: arsenite methyltransferase, partial [Aeromicrobium sp.]
ENAADAIEENASSCCSPVDQETCCEPAAKSACCDSDADGSCGCQAGQSDNALGVTDEIREAVRERYANAAKNTTSCCGPSTGQIDRSVLDEHEREVFGFSQYGADDGAALPEDAKAVSLGCGNPTAVAELHEGETVLDLGSGGGIDVLLSARRVGKAGKAYGLDMTDEMLDLARKNAAEAQVDNVEFIKGTIEEIPLPNESVDVVISNCVINLSGDKHQTLREAARVLKPGGRFAVSDVIADEGMDEKIRQDMAQWTGCIAGALTEREFTDALAAAGFRDISIQETHRVHDAAASAIVRARR